MKLLIDMNLSPQFTDMLASKGVNSVHWSNVGLLDAQDTEIVAYAEKHDYFILTCDLDFSAILSATQGRKPSVIQLRMQCLDIEKVATIIADAVIQNKRYLDEGAILVINSQKARVRLLPL